MLNSEHHVKLFELEQSIGLVEQNIYEPNKQTWVERITRCIISSTRKQCFQIVLSNLVVRVVIRRLVVVSHRSARLVEPSRP